tara:strand:- start:344 stop:772 length:429 start_codon:yes stop_codon:yes gene_type:complete
MTVLHVSKVLNMFSLLKFFVIIFRGGWNIINPNINPLRSAPPHIKYFASILLGCFWSLAFGLYTAQFFFIGLNMLAHIGIISMVFATWYTFRYSRKTYGSVAYPLMRDPSFSPKCYEMTDAEKLVSIEQADKLLASQKTIKV